MILAIGCDNLVEIDQLKNERTGLFVNDASLSMRVLDGSLEVISGETALPMSHETGTTGKYCGTVPSTLELQVNARYFIEVFGSGESLDLLLRIPCRAQYVS